VGAREKAHRGARFEFDDFTDAIDFVNSVAEVAEEEEHHPDIDIRFNKVRLVLSTHSKGGLTDLDFALGGADRHRFRSSLFCATGAFDRSSALSSRRLLVAGDLEIYRLADDPRRPPPKSIGTPPAAKTIGGRDSTPKAFVVGPTAKTGCANPGL